MRRAAHSGPGSGATKARQFVNERKAMAAVEFAIIGAPLLLMLVEIFQSALSDIPQIGFGPSPILLPFGSFGKVESSSLAKDGALFICPAVPSLKNTDFPIIKTHLSLSFHSNA
jgi:hypothetical protein